MRVFAPIRALSAAALFLFALLCAVAVPSSAAAQQLVTRSPENFDHALAAARAERQLLMVYVSSKDCVWCRHFERTHLADPAFIAWTRALFQFVAVDQDNPRHRAWLKERSLDGESVPRYYLLDASGRRIAASRYSAKFAPLKAVQLFDQVKGFAPPFDVGRLTQAARELAAYRERAPSEELRLSYGAMEALTWHWLGNGQNALAAFGPGVAAILERGPGQGGDLEAWDEIRLWYVGFWSAYAPGMRNFPAAFRVAARGFETRGLPQYARWAAFLAEQMGRLDAAAHFGERYLAAAKLPADHPFRQRVAEWKRAAKR